MLLQKACRQACGESLTLLYRKYRKPICDFLHKRGADGLAEDICQEVFCRIHEGRCGYDGSSEVKSYLFGIAKYIHKEEIEDRETLSRYFAALQAKYEGYAKSGSSQVFQMPQSVQTDNLLAIKIADLPPKASQAIKLVYQEGVPAVKAAAAANCSFKMFRKRLCYGLRVLRKNLRNERR